MTCVVHAERPAAAYCRACGKALCEECKRSVRGVVYCEDCLAKELAGATPPAPSFVPSGDSPSPGAALGLGFIPGVGAIYNGQYAKAFVHVVILGILISILNSGAAGPFEPLFGLMLMAFFFYMALEAYHTAKKRQAGLPVDEWSGFLSPGRGLGRTGGALILILLGVVFLLNNLGVFSLSAMLKYWPVALILVGLMMLVERLRGPKSTPPSGDEGGLP